MSNHDPQPPSKMRSISERTGIVIAIVAISFCVLFAIVVWPGLPWKVDEIKAARIQAFAALAQFAFTSFLLFLTWSSVQGAERSIRASETMAEEGLAARIDAALPVLDLVLHSSQPDDDPATDTFIVDVKNAGIGPAVFVRVRWIPRKDNELKVPCEIVDSPEVSALGPGASYRLVFRTSWIESYQPLSDQTWLQGFIGGMIVDLGYLDVTYFDVHERRGEICRGIDFVNWRGPAEAQFRIDERTVFQPPGHAGWRAADDPFYQ